MRVFSLLDMPDGIGPAGTKTVGRWPKASAPMTRPGTILSQMPSIRAPSNMSWLSATAVAMAITSRLNSDSSMPVWPWVTPSHMAGTPPATWATARRLARGLADQLREALVGLMRREHVVVGGDDADVGPSAPLELAPCRAAPQAAKAWARLPQDRAVAARPAARPASSRSR